MHTLAPSSVESYNPDLRRWRLDWWVQDLGQMFTRPLRDWISTALRYTVTISVLIQLHRAQGFRHVWGICS